MTLIILTYVLIFSLLPLFQSCIGTLALRFSGSSLGETRGMGSQAASAYVTCPQTLRIFQDKQNGGLQIYCSDNGYLISCNLRCRGYKYFLPSEVGSTSRQPTDELPNQANVDGKGGGEGSCAKKDRRPRSRHVTAFSHRSLSSI
jgi:hypothetical protein